MALTTSHDRAGTRPEAAARAPAATARAGPGPDSGELEPSASLTAASEAARSAGGCGTVTVTHWHRDSARDHHPSGRWPARGRLKARFRVGPQPRRGATYQQNEECIYMQKDSEIFKL